MTRCSKSLQPGVHVSRKRLADGSIREYHYPRNRPRSSRYGADSVAALISAWKISPEWAALSPITVGGYTTYLRDLELLARMKAVDVTRRDILSVRDAIATTRGNGAATGFVRAAGACFAWGVERGWVEHSPCHKIRRLKGGHLPEWSEDQIAVALDRLPDYLRRAVLLALYTGQRRGDLCAMTWAAYDGATVRLRQGKTGKALVIPLHPVLRAEMAGWKRNATSTHILTTRTGVPWIPTHLSQDLGRALVAIGFPPGWNIHGLRKVAAARLADAGCTVHEIASITGHSSLALVALYTRRADQERLANAAIGRLGGTREGGGGKST